MRLHKCNTKRILIFFIIFIILIFFNDNIFAKESFQMTDNSLLMGQKELNNRIYLNYKDLDLPEFNVKGIYVTGWVAGISSRMENLINLIEETQLNTMVIDVKDDQGYISYPSHVEMAKNLGASQRKINNVEEFLERLNEKGIYTIARIPVFKDALLASSRPELALLINNGPENISWGLGKENFNKSSGQLIYSASSLKQAKIEKYNISRSKSWVDPTRTEVWDYNISLGREAIELGFDEVQFDYVRYPALKGKNRAIIYKGITKEKAINDFIIEANQRFKKFDYPLSIDVFGLSTSAECDLGIGQNFKELSSNIDIISPMVYPSHYSPGIYGLDFPEKDPYKTVYRSMRDAQKKTEDNDVLLRPWIQDFSINYKYSSHEVKEQLKALEKLGIEEWLLWNPSSRYTKDALN